MESTPKPKRELKMTNKAIQQRGYYLKNKEDPLYMEKKRSICIKSRAYLKSKELENKD